MVGAHLLQQRPGSCSLLLFIFLPYQLCISQQFQQELVYFATDRDSLDKDPSTTLLSKPETGNYLDGLKYGVVNVGIPVATANQYNTSSRSVTRTDDVVIYSIENMGNNYTQFIQNITSIQSSNIKMLSSTISLDLFMFIHGFFTTFEDAIKRMAQLKFDLSFAGPAIAYSWSSRGLITSYGEDEVSVENTIPFCVEFIKLCVAKVEGGKMHVLAHSMGSRALIGSLQSLYTESDIGQVLSNGKIQLKSLIFAAADENVERFETMVASVKGVHEARGDEEDKRPHMTIYSATDDTALKISNIIHGKPRLGLTTTHFDKNVHTLDEDPRTGYIDVIDATKLDSNDEGIHHSYYGNNPLCLQDIQTLLSSPPPLHRAYFRALHGASPIFNVTYSNIYHFYSFSPSFWNASTVL